MFRHAYFSNHNGLNFVFEGKRMRHKDGTAGTSENETTREKIGDICPYCSNELDVDCNEFYSERTGKLVTECFLICPVCGIVGVYYDE